jgi:hypothetical protein
VGSMGGRGGGDMDDVTTRVGEGLGSERAAGRPSRRQPAGGCIAMG